MHERAGLHQLRAQFDNPEARQLASAQELLSAFRKFQHFIDKWMQAGRLPHLAPGHYAIQEALLIAIPIGSLLLWKSAAMSSEVKSEIFERLVKMVSMHVQHVQMLVPRFHIAYWTALHYVLGLLLLRDFIDVLQNSSAVSLAPLTTLFENCLDVAEVFDADAAESYKSMMSHRQVQSASGSRAFQNITADPSKLAAFYSIDPELPLERKMAQMADILQSSEPAKSHSSHLPVPMPALKKQLGPQAGASHDVSASTCLDTLD